MKKRSRLLYLTSRFPSILFFYMDNRNRETYISKKSRLLAEIQQDSAQIPVRIIFLPKQE